MLWSRRPITVALTASLVGISALALLAVPEPAEACGKGVCPRGYFAPRDTTTVPLNVPALVHAGSAPPPDGAAAVTLTTSAGAPVAFVSTPTPGSFTVLLRPSAPLVQGETYVISQYQSCGTGASVGFAQQTFLAGPAAPLPTTLGQIVQTQRYVDDAYRELAGTKCWDTQRTAVTRLIFEPSAELVPWLPVTTFTFRVDGSPYGASLHGHGPNDVMPHPWWDRWLVEAHGACEEPTKESQLDRGLALGTHSYQLEARIAGVETSVGTIAGTFELGCDGVAVGPPAGAAGASGAAGAGNSGPGPAGGAPPSVGGSGGGGAIPVVGGSAALGGGAGAASSGSGAEAAPPSGVVDSGCALRDRASGDASHGLVSALAIVALSGRRKRARVLFVALPVRAQAGRRAPRRAAARVS